MRIWRITRKAGGKALYILRCLKWFCYYKWTTLKPRRDNYLKQVSWYRKGRVLLIAPHADDELLSSYTLLKNCRDITVYYCGFTGSDPSIENRNTRQREIEQLCKMMNIPVINGYGSCENLAIAIKDYDVIVVPSIVDWHPEHRKVSYLLYDILKETSISPQIYSYSVTVPNESLETILALPMNRTEQNDKYRIFNKIYHSQKFMPVYRFRINERINGYHAQTFAAELFLHHHLEKWLWETNHVMLAEQSEDPELKRLIKTVGRTGDMSIAREASREFYQFVAETKV